MKKCTNEINDIRAKFQNFIIENDVTLQVAAESVGWKHAASVSKFLDGKVKRPPMRRLYRIAQLLNSKKQRGNHERTNRADL